MPQAETPILPVYGARLDVAVQDTPIRAGQATTIQHPYTGKVPENITSAPRVGAEISQAAVEAASAELDAVEGTPQFTASVRRVMQNIFNRMGGQRKVTLNSVTMDNAPYIVELNRGITAKIASDKNMTPEKLAVFTDLDSMIKDAEFVGSGKYGKTKNKASHVIRYDYFERVLQIDGRPFVMTFDVEIMKGTQNFRTYRVINEMDLQPVTAIPQSFSGSNITNQASPSLEESITQGGAEVNQNSEEMQSAQAQQEQAQAQTAQAIIPTYGESPQAALEREIKEYEAKREKAKAEARGKPTAQEASAALARAQQEAWIADGYKDAPAPDPDQQEKFAQYVESLRSPAYEAKIKAAQEAQEAQRAHEAQHVQEAEQAPPAPPRTRGAIATPPPKTMPRGMPGLAGMPNPATAKQNTRTRLHRNIVSGQAELERFAKLEKKASTNAVNVEDLTQMVRAAAGTVSTIAETKLVSRAGDVIGDSWKYTVGTLTPAQSKELNLYRLHKHNIDRMSLHDGVKAEHEAVNEKIAAFRGEHPFTASKTPAQLMANMKGYDANTLQYKLAKEYLGLQAQEVRLSQIVNKPVIGHKEAAESEYITPYTAEESREMVAEMDQEHPRLAAQAKRVEDFHDTFMREWAVGSGLMSMEAYEAMRRKYPNYIQTFRVNGTFGDENSVTHKGGVDVRSPIKQAVGSVDEIVPFEDAEMAQINQIVRAARRNELFLNLYEYASSAANAAAPFVRVLQQTANAQENAEKIAVEGADVPQSLDEFTQTLEDGAMRDEGGTYTITAMKKGVPVKMQVSAEFYAGLQNLYSLDRGAAMDALTGSIGHATNAFKQVTTGLNPTFPITNFAKDIQTGYANTISDTKTFAGYAAGIGKAAVHMKRGSADWTAFKALGGRDSGYYHNNSGFTESELLSKRKGIRGAVDKVKDVLGFVGENTEAIMRFAEYRAGIAKYGDTQAGRTKAIQAAADVTVNFSRSAPVAKMAEQCVPYLNAGIQGIDKMARQLKAHPVQTTRRTLEMLTVPTILLWLVNHDDEDYQNLNDRTKDNYFCIPTGNGRFIKIPKSREYGVLFSAVAERALRALSDGEPIETAFKGLWSQFTSNLVPANPVTDNILKTAFIDLPTNTDFAGRAIEPERMRALSPENRYDFNTSGAGKLLSSVWNAAPGRVLGEVSPIQMDYMIDSNLGFVGDAIIGSTTQPKTLAQLKIEYGEKPWKLATDPITDTLGQKFTADPLYQNGVTDRFYKALDAAEIAKNDINFEQNLDSRIVTPEEKYYSTLLAHSNDIADLRRREREILASNQTDAQREEQVRELRRQILEIAKRAEGDALKVQREYLKTYVPQISYLSEEKQERARKAFDSGVAYEDFARYSDKLSEEEKESSRNTERMQLLDEMNEDKELSATQRDALVEQVLIQGLGENRLELWESLKGKVTPIQFMDIAGEQSRIDEEIKNMETDGSKATMKATAFSMFLDGLALDDAVRAEVESKLKYFQMFPAESAPYRWDMLESSDAKKYAPALEESGMSIRTYNAIKSACGEFSADKDKNGKTISGTKKDKVVRYVRGLEDLTTAQKNLMIQAMGYKVEGGSGGNSGSHRGGSGASTSKTGAITFATPKMPKLPLPKFGG